MRLLRRVVVLPVLLILAAAVSPAAFAAYDQTVKADGPAGYWRLGEASGTTANDSSGNLAHGTYKNGTALGHAGGIIHDASTAGRFDGSNDMVDMGDRFDFAGNVGFSLEAWVKPSALPAGKVMHVISTQDQPDAATRDGYSLHVSSGSGFAIERWVNGVQVGVGSSGPVVPGRWYHVVGTYDGATMRVYLNGVLHAFRDDARATVDHAGVFTLGDVHWNGGGNAFSGDLDEAAAYAKPSHRSASSLTTRPDVGRSAGGASTSSRNRSWVRASSSA